MIQRVQSIFLLLAVVLLTMTNLVPLASFQMPSGEIQFISVTASNWGNATWVVLITTLLAAVTSLATIFLYKKRKIQIRLSYLALVLIALQYGYFFGYTYASTSMKHVSIASLTGIFMPLVAFICIILAIRKIKADEKLVRSLDRIR